MKDTNIILQEVSAILNIPRLGSAMRDYKSCETGTECGKPKDDDDKSTIGPLQLAVT